MIEKLADEFMYRYATEDNFPFNFKDNIIQYLSMARGVGFEEGYDIGHLEGIKFQNSKHANGLEVAVIAYLDKECTIEAGSYRSKAEAARIFKLKSKTSISHAILTGQRCKGFYWKENNNKYD